MYRMNQKWHLHTYWLKNIWKIIDYHQKAYLIDVLPFLVLGSPFIYITGLYLDTLHSSLMFFMLLSFDPFNDDKFKLSNYLAYLPLYLQAIFL